MNNKFPIHDVLDEIKEKININNKLVLEASAGAGKSTVVPISLLNEAFLMDKKILVLEPRRVATRAVAKQMAHLLNEQVGQTVGYQIKNESVYSKETKVLVVTEGILTRRLQKDQSLEDIALVIFDEFHERSIHTDIGLALCLEVQELLRDDLKILIMSATLNSKALLNLLGESSFIQSKGRVFPIEEVYLEQNIKHPNINEVNTLLIETIEKSIKNDKGDILVFLAGLKEIKYIENKLINRLENIDILALHSSLSKEEQDRAIQKSHNRKLILSTNIAQTSLTIDGIKVVIDSGLEKIMRFSSLNNMNYLEYSFISKDSAIQRAGRAGRLSKGKCYRLWHKNRILEESSSPDILNIDLSTSFLELSLWGVKSFGDLKFLDIPSKSKEDLAKKSLQDLEMLDDTLKLTKFGEEAINLGLHPRLSHMILKAKNLGFVYEACVLASILIQNDKSKSIEESFEFISKSIKYESKQLYKRLKLESTYKARTFKTEYLSILLLFAYPDRLAKLRVNDEYKYKLSNSKGAILNKSSKLFNKQYLVVANLDARINESYIHEALEIKFEYIQEHFSSYIHKEEQITFDRINKKLDNKTFYKFLDLELYSKVNEKIKEEKFLILLLELIRSEKLELLNFCKKSQALINRINFLNNQNLETIKLPSYDTASLINDLDIWLKPYILKIDSIRKLEDLDFYSILLSRLTWEEQQTLDKLVPDFIIVPSASKIKIDYSNNETPILKVKIQELFGLDETPKIVNKQVLLQIHLLTPALRPIQITNNLSSFWKNSYDEVKKELRGKYKKHYWPDDPSAAKATNKTKKFM
jgi:ATP-dependent helicase HrpB